MCPIYFGGQKVKGQGHNALIIGNGLCRIISFPLHLSSWNFTHRLPMSRGCALFILGSKGQRSRSQCIDCRKRFMSHNFFLFTPIIMKLHTQTPHESRMLPYLFWGQKVKGQGHNALIIGNGLCRIISFPLHLLSWNFTHRTPHESRICPTYFGVKRSKVKVTMHWL